MRTTTAAFDTKHALATKTPKYLVKFDAEDLENQYTTVDPNSRFAFDGSELTFTGVRRDEEAYISRDYGAGFWAFDGVNSFQHQMDVKLTGEGVTNGRLMATWVFTNALDSVDDIDDGGGDYIALRLEWGGADGDIDMRVVECNSGSVGLSPVQSLAQNTQYYLTLTYDATNGTYGKIFLYTYSDADRTTLVSTRSEGLTKTHSFRYFHAANSYNESFSRAVSGVIDNIVLGPDYTNHKAAGAHHQQEYLGDIRGGSQTVTPEKGKASIGGITLTLQDQNDELTKRLSSDAYYYHRKKVTIKAGYMGMAESDMLNIMVGWVTGMKLARDGAAYVLDITDPLKWMQRKVFRGSEDATVTLSGNPINIVLQIITSTGDGTNGDYDTLAAANGLGISTDYVNVTSIEAVRDDWFPGPSVRMSFTITKRVQAKKWLEQEIYKIINVYPVIDADGKFNLKAFKPPMPATVTVQTFDKDNIIDLPGYDFNLGDLINEVECKYDHDGSDFLTEDFYIDATSLNNRGPGKSPLVLESKGITTAQDGSDFFALRKTRIFQRYATPPPKYIASTWFSRWLTEAGDIVPFSHPALPNTESGTRGLTSERMEVINRNIDWKRGAVKITLLATGFEKDPYCQISPAMTVASGTSATEFEVSAADAAKFSEGQEIAMHYANMVIQSANVTITDITGTTITVDSMGATPAAGWIAQYAPYDNCTADQKLYWFASDSNDYLGAADDPAHLITA